MQTLKEVNDFFKREAVLQNLKDENERLREALQEILREIDDEWDGKYGIDGLRHIACKALGEKK
jgi:hypothetical protein